MEIAVSLDGKQLLLEHKEAKTLKQAALPLELAAQLAEFALGEYADYIEEEPIDCTYITNYGGCLIGIMQSWDTLALLEHCLHEPVNSVVEDYGISLDLMGLDLQQAEAWQDLHDHCATLGELKELLTIIVETQMRLWG